MPSMASKVYILILLTCLPVILGESPMSSPVESPKPVPPENFVLDANQLLKNAGGDGKKALIANLQAMLVLLNQTIASIDKNLPSIADRNVSSCVKISREEYVSVIKVIVQGIEKLKRNERWIGNSTARYIEEEFQYTRSIFLKYTDTESPFFTENDVLLRMSFENFKLTEKVPTAEEEEDSKLAKSRLDEVLKNAGGDYRKALIANLQAMQVPLNQTIAAMDKALPSLKDRSVSSCVARARDVYLSFTKEIVQGIERVKKNDTWSPYGRGFGSFSYVKILFDSHATINPFHKENDFLHKMSLPSNGLTEGIPIVSEEEEEDECEPEETRPLESPIAKEMLKKAGGDRQKALITNFQAMLVLLNQTITAIDKTLPSLKAKPDEYNGVDIAKGIYEKTIKNIEAAIDIVRKNERGTWTYGIAPFGTTPSEISEKFTNVYDTFNYVAPNKDAISNPFSKENDELQKMADLNLELIDGILAVSC